MQSGRYLRRSSGRVCGRGLLELGHGGCLGCQDGAEAAHERAQHMLQSNPPIEMLGISIFSQSADSNKLVDKTCTLYTIHIYIYISRRYNRHAY